MKQIIHHCTICRRFEGASYHAPPPPPLPEYRVQEAPPFTTTGVDFAGPLYLRSTDGAQSKVWICLYTCCVVRAVHLDLVPDMSAPTFLRSFKRFSARRGLPSRVVSDNRKTFKAAAKTIQAVLTHEDVKRYFSGLGVKWVFNLSKAPWWGGIFERIVRSTKRCLKKILGQAKLSYDELLTALTEVEMVLNSRPLTYVSADDFEEPLTPSHLLIGRRVMTLPDPVHSEDNDEEVTADTLTRRSRHLNLTLNRFWKRWKDEYLLELIEAHRHNKGTDAAPVQVGDVVVVHCDNQPRGFWKLARVEQTITGRDGRTRGAAVRVANSKGRATTLHRPIQSLYPLEINSQEKESHSNSPNPDDNSEEPDEAAVRRSNRAAASEARDRILAHSLSEN